MKTMTTRLLAVLLAVLMLLCAVGCKKPDDQQGENTNNNGNNQGTVVDPATDGVFNEKDYDPKKDYQLPDYSKLTITDYVALGRYKNLTLTVAEKDFLITDAMLEERIKTILKENHPDAEITDRAIAWNDTVVVDYVGKKEGVAFEGGAAEKQTIEVTEKNGYIPGFVDSLVGAMPGTTIDAPVKFQDDYHAKALAGKDVIFTFTIHYIVGNPQLTDDFVATYTEGKFTTAADYKADLKAQMQTDAYDLAVRMAFWSKISENAALKKDHEDAIMYYYGYYYDMYSYYAAYYGMTIDIYLMYMQISLNGIFEACRNIFKDEMVYYAVFAAENYTYTDEQYQRALELYTDENLEKLNEMMTAAGKEAYTREGAMEYFDKEEKQTIVLQTLEEIAYNTLIEGYTIEVTPAEDNKTESGSAQDK